MRIGILADIHGHVGNLRKAVQQLRRMQVDLFVVLGDVIYDSNNAVETIAVLKDCGAVGVWGNHELGLCVDPEEDLCSRFAESVVDFCGTLRPQYECGEFLFSHTLPDQDANDPFAYYLSPRPHEDGALDGCFSAYPHRVIMVGHFHRWFAATPSARLSWDGSEPFQLDPTTRYFFVIHAVMEGWAAVMDDESNTLSPIRL